MHLALKVGYQIWIYRESRNDHLKKRARYVLLDTEGKNVLIQNIEGNSHENDGVDLKKVGGSLVDDEELLGGFVVSFVDELLNFT